MARRVVAPALALIALASASAAQAQQKACVAPADFSDAVLYAMPIAYDAVSTSCERKLNKDGFVARHGSAFIANFRSRQDSAWPGAFRLIKVFVADANAVEGKSGGNLTAMITALPEKSLRPFVDGMVGQLIAAEIKPDFCGKIERGLELLALLPPEKVAGVLAFITELTELKKPSICSVTPPAKLK